MLFGKKQAPAETPAQEPEAQQPSADFVPRQQFEELMGKFDQLQSNFTQYLMEQQKPKPMQQAAPQWQPPRIEDVPDEDFKRAVREGGEGAEAIIAKRMRAENLRAQLPVLQELHTIRTQGIASIAGLTRQQIKAMPYYEMFAKEIDQQLDQLDPSLQTNPDVLQFVYKQVVGANVDKITEQKVQEAIRKAQEVPAEEPVSKGRIKSSKGEEIPAPEELFGKDGMDALESRYGSRSEAAVQRFVQAIKQINDRLG